MVWALYLQFAIEWIALFCNFSILQSKTGVHELQYMSWQKPFQSTLNPDGTRYFVWNLLNMRSPTQVSIDCKATEVTFCHSFNLLWIYSQLRGSRIYIALMIMKKHEFCFLCIIDRFFILSHSEMRLSSSLLFSDISYIFTACMDYMDPDVCCPQKGCET